MNIMQIFGFVGRDVERKVMPNGGILFTLNIGVKSKKNKEELTHWYRVNMWGETRWEKLVPHLKKGSSVIVMGEFFPSQYTNKDGEVIMNLELTAESVKFSPFGKSENKEGNQARVPMQPSPKSSPIAQHSQENSYQDDLPF